MKLLVFSEAPKRKNPFSYDDRVVIEDGIPTIRPYRNHVPGSTNKELEVAFAEFRTAMENNTLWLAKNGTNVANVMEEQYVQEDFELDFTRQY